METAFLGVPEVDAAIFFGLAATSLATAFIATVTGAAGGLLLLGVMALVFPPVLLIPLHTVAMLGDNLTRIAVMRLYIVKSALPPFLIGAIIGAALGGKIFVSLPEATLQLILGLCILVFVWMPRMAAIGSMASRLGAVGFIATFVGIFVSATGALVAPFFAAAYPDRRNVIATFSAAMGLLHLCKLVAFGLLGASLGAYLPLMAAMLATSGIGNFLGSRALHRVREESFRLVFKIVLTALALRILWLAAENAEFL